MVVRQEGDVPLFLKPNGNPGPQTVTASMFSDPSVSEDSDDIRADHWFAADRSDRYYIRESCSRAGPDSVVTLLWWEDEKQLIDLVEAEERHHGRRVDWRDE